MSLKDGERFRGYLRFQKGYSLDQERCIVSSDKKRQPCQWGTKGKNFTLLKKIDKISRFRYTCFFRSTHKSRRTGNLQTTISIDQGNSIISLKGVAWEDAKLPRGF